MLICKYKDSPKANSHLTMHVHYGTARLNLLDGGTRLAGEYYIGRERQSYLILELEKTQVIN